MKNFNKIVDVIGIASAFLVIISFLVLFHYHFLKNYGFNAWNSTLLYCCFIVNFYIRFIKTNFVKRWIVLILAIAFGVSFWMTIILGVLSVYKTF